MLEKMTAEEDEKELKTHTFNIFQIKTLTLLFGTYRTDTLPVVSPI